MKSDKAQTIFLQLLDSALRDPRWRKFIRSRLRDSELPVIDLDNRRRLPIPPSGNKTHKKAGRVEEDNKESVIGILN